MLDFVSKSLEVVEAAKDFASEKGANVQKTEEVVCNYINQYQEGKLTVSHEEAVETMKELVSLLKGCDDEKFTALRFIGENRWLKKQYKYQFVYFFEKQ